jgi:hypothetical protein
MYSLTSVNPDAMRAEVNYRHGVLAAEARQVIDTRPSGHRRRWRRRAPDRFAQS